MNLTPAKKIKDYVVQSHETQRLLEENLNTIFNEFENLIQRTLNSSSVSKHKIIFQGINLSENESGELELDIAGLTQKITPHGITETKLKQKIMKKKLKIDTIKLKFEKIISFGGDISEDQSNYFRDLSDLLLEDKNEINAIEYKNENLTDDELNLIINESILKNLIKRIEKLDYSKGHLVKVVHKSQSGHEDISGLKFGSLLIDISHESQNLKILKKEISYYKLLLEYWRSVLREVHIDENVRIHDYFKPSDKGLPRYYTSEFFNLTGFYKDDEWIDCIYEDVRGSYIIGKFIKGEMFGEGKIVYSLGNYFIGEIFEDKTSIGEYFQEIDGVVISTSLKVKKNRGRFFYEKGDYYKIYENGCLIREGKYFGSNFTGIVYVSGIYYDRVWCKGKFHAISYSYEGNYLNGMFHGEGIYKENNGFTIKQGKFFKGKFIEGTLVIGDKCYSGKYNFSGDIEGHGEFKSPELEYKGNFKNNKFEGNGELKIANGTTCEGIFYRGEFINGNQFTENYKCTGKFKNGKINGRGKMTFKDGMIFEGIFLNGDPSKGTLIIGDSILSGSFNSKFELEGDGKLTTNEYIYTGRFHNGKMNGYGNLRFNNGDTYNGRFSEGALKRGSLMCSNFTFIGEFTSDFQPLKGIYKKPSLY